MPNARPDELTEQFESDVARLTGGEGRIGLAVSGGADSLALLLLASATMAERVMVATVDHGLRPEAADEAAYVGKICSQLNLSHHILTPQIRISGSLQASARAARYELLNAWADEHDLRWIATAHHIEDQAETLMMRLLRGSGVEGLASIRERNERVIRPLLSWRRANLRAVVEAAGINPVDDPSNDDPRFDRVRMRRLLAENEWIDAPALAKSAGALSGINTALDWAAASEAKRRITHDGAGIALDPNDIPDELLRRLTLIALRATQPALTPRGEQVSALITTLTAGGKSTLGGVMAVGGGIWHFTPAPPRRTI